MARTVMRGCVPGTPRVNRGGARAFAAREESDMQDRNIWWFGECDPDTLADFERRAICALDLESDPPPAAAAREHCFADVCAVGDVIVVASAADGTLHVGDVEGEALRRPAISCMQLVRSVHWHVLPLADDEASDIEHSLKALPTCSPIDPDAHPALTAVIDVVPDDEAPPLAFEIDLRPPKIPPPALPNLYQSPFAGRILRDFRWREYLIANPDVAATGDSEAHAFGHFFHQGYYERRIFDPARLDGFDPGFYRARYPELALPTDAAAQIHYCYQGWYEQRIPNRDSAWLHDAALHVYQMGKVGSHAIAAALEAAGYDGGVLHLHWPTDVVTGYPSNRLAYSRILVHERACPVKVISATREIVSWTLSGLFQYHGGAVLNAADAVALIEERFWDTCGSGLRWFDHRYHCDLDVYAHPFDHAAGYTCIDHAGIELLIYRQEDLSRMAAPLAGFLGVPDLRLDPRNVGEDKAYSGLYRRILRDFRLPGNLLSTLYDSAFMRHFYSDAEREAAYARWVRRD